MLMEGFLVIGANHRNMDLVARERFLSENPFGFLKESKERHIIGGFVIISTCLRIEAYAEMEKGQDKCEILAKVSSYGDKIYALYGKDAVRHLFTVTCGLDSIIVGEDQILSQIKKNYLSSLERKETSPVINTIFNNAIALGKKFRSISAVSTNPLSLERIAVNFIKQHFYEISDKKVFLIGVGDMSRQILHVLKKEGVNDITVTNRTSHNPETIVQFNDVHSVGYDRKYDLINASDIIVSATSAPHNIIKKDELLQHLTVEKERFFLDIAVPRDIEETVSTIDGAVLYNIDDLWKTYNDNKSERKEVSGKYTYLIDDQMKECCRWFERRNGRKINA
jgi:glutamyl-tRNA reductase